MLTASRARHRRPHHRRGPLAGTGGQAAVEFVAVLPLVALLAAAAWQVVVAGHAIWSVGAAARAAARADALGRDPEAAARARLTDTLERDLRVRREDGWVRVSVRIPAVLVPLGDASSAARFGQEPA